MIKYVDVERNVVLKKKKKRCEPAQGRI